MNKMRISVVVPAYNERDNIKPLYEKVKSVLDRITKDYEIIIVDDGSTDGTFEAIREINKKDKRLVGIKFQRNFQKAAALSAGFAKASGDVIVTMDADLQDDPEEIPKFLEKIRQGNDIVIGWRHEREDSVSKKIASKIFNFLVRKFTGVKIHDSDCNFRVMKKEVAKSLEIYEGLYRYIPSLAKNNGFKVDEVKVVHHKRLHGKSKYGAGRLLKGFFDLITVSFFLNYMKRPLHLFGFSGLASSTLGFIIAAYLAFIRLVYGEPIGDRPLLLLAVLLIVLGLQFISIGLLGEMINRKNQKTEKNYIIKEELN